MGYKTNINTSGNTALLFNNNDDSHANNEFYE